MSNTEIPQIPMLAGSLSEWVSRAAPGDRVIVQRSKNNQNRNASILRGSGLILTAQRRVKGTDLFDLIAVKLSVPKKQDPPPSSRGRMGRLYRGPDDPE